MHNSVMKRKEEKKEKKRIKLSQGNNSGVNGWR